MLRFVFDHVYFILSVKNGKQIANLIIESLTCDQTYIIKSLSSKNMYINQQPTKTIEHII